MVFRMDGAFIVGGEQAVVIRAMRGNEAQYFGMQLVDGLIIDEAVSLAEVGAMEDDLLGVFGVVVAPVVANGGDVAVAVVVEGIFGAAVFVAEDGIATPVVFGAHVDVVVIDGSDAPQVARNLVAAQLGLVVRVHAIDADATAAVHGVGLCVVVDEAVVDDEGTQVVALLVVAIAVVFYDVVFQQDFGFVGVHQVGDGDAARHVVAASFDGAIHDADGVSSARSEVDLWLVDVGGHIVVEGAVCDLRRAFSVDGRTNGRAFVVLEEAVVKDGVAVHEVDRLRPGTGPEKPEVAVHKRRFAPDDLEFSQISKQDFRKTTRFRAVLKAERGVVGSGVAANPAVKVFGTFCNHGTFDG